MASDNNIKEGPPFSFFMLGRCNLEELELAVVVVLKI